MSSYLLLNLESATVFLPVRENTVSLSLDRAVVQERFGNAGANLWDTRHRNYGWSFFFFIIVNWYTVFVSWQIIINPQEGVSLSRRTGESCFS